MPADKRLPVGGLDEDVIDLDDIIELSAEAVDEEEDREVEILDADLDLDFKQPEISIEPLAQEATDNDFLDKFSFPPERKTEEDLVDSFNLEKAPSEDFLFPFLDERPAGESREEVMESGLKERPEGRSDILEPAKEQEGGPGLDLPAAMISAGKPGDSGTDASAPAGREETGPSLDEIVSKIEADLSKALKDLVESRLPEIVRTVLREEIERLKKESE